jgi:hypothetical protein
MATKEITVLPLHYDLFVWYANKLGSYPKKFKYNVGERIINCFLDILESIIEAQYTSKKKSHFLRKANLSLEKLRFLVRLSKDVQCISLKDYEYAIRQINDIGKMVGGWEKYSKEKEDDGKEA